MDRLGEGRKGVKMEKGTREKAHPSQGRFWTVVSGGHNFKRASYCLSSIDCILICFALPMLTLWGSSPDRYFGPGAHPVTSPE